MSKHYKHLSLDERSKISVLQAKGESIRSIGKIIGRSASTISREIKRIKSKISVMTGRITNKPYNAADAQNDYNYKRALSKAEYKLEKYPIITPKIVLL